jgi:hypothetical protein
MMMTSREHGWYSSFNSHTHYARIKRCTVSGCKTARRKAWETHPIDSQTAPWSVDLKAVVDAQDQRVSSVSSSEQPFDRRRVW